MNSGVSRIGHKRLILLSSIGLGLLLLFAHQSAVAKPKKAPKTMNVIMIGDRLVDVAYNLGVLPEAMSVRCSLWPMCKQLRNASQVLGCPKCIVERIPNIVPDTAKKRGITRIIIEKHPEFCIYEPKVKPENVVPLLAGKHLTIEYVDFSHGLELAIRRTAQLLGCESKAKALIERYHKPLAKAKNALPKTKLEKKVVIICGVYQQATGKTFRRVEAPGGYSDRFLLEPLGCVNVGYSLKSATTHVEKGHFLTRKLDALAKARPDVIVMTGDAFAVQKALCAEIRKHPALAELPAVKNHAIYNLPFYGDSSVIEYPAILRQWALALAN